MAWLFKRPKTAEQLALEAEIAAKKKSIAEMVLARAKLERKINERAKELLDDQLEADLTNAITNEKK